MRSDQEVLPRPKLSQEDTELLLESIIPYQINSLSHKMNKLLDQELREQGLSISNWRVMAVLDFNSRVSVNELASYALIEQSTLSRLLQRMESDGYVELRRANNDGRAREIVLTSFGRERYDAVRNITMKHVSRIVSGFNKSERIMLTKFISRMQQNIASDESSDLS